MSKVKTSTQENNFSVLQILGSLFLIFAVADFALSWISPTNLNLNFPTM